MALPKSARTVARYSIEGVHALPAGLGVPPRNQNAHTKLAAIPDPMPDEKGRHPPILATVNCATDILEYELAHDLITDAAYSVGRLAEAIFARARGSGSGGQWRQGDRVDAWVAHELAIIRGLENARKIRAWVRSVEREVGVVDARILRQILADRMTYDDVAAARGRAGDRGKRYFAQRFRDALETLAERWVARGRGRKP